MEFDACEGRFEVDRLCAVMERLAGWQPVGMFHPDRYALQLHIPALAAFEALRIATTEHDEAVRVLGASNSFSRAEVLTLSEFEATWLDYAVPNGSAARRPQAGGLVPTEVYDATRALIDAPTASAATEILMRFVLAVGGTVQIGPPPDAPGFVSFELSAPPTQHLHALANATSVARLVLERWLPPLLEDARRTAVAFGRG